MIRRQVKKHVRELAQRKEIERKLKKSGLESVVQDLSVSDSLRRLSCCVSVALFYVH